MAKQMQIETVQTKSPGKQPKIRRKRFAWLRRDWQLYAMMAIPVIWYLVFCYKPMAGLVIAFQKYNIFKGIKGSQWVGLENFKFVFQMRDFGIALKNINDTEDAYKIHATDAAPICNGFYPMADK